MSKPLTDNEMIREGLEELKDVYKEEKEKNDISNSKINQKLAEIEETIQKIDKESLSDEELVDEIVQIVGQQDNFLDVIDSFIEQFESEEKTEKAENKHDTRHQVIGVTGGVIRYATYLTESKNKEDQLERYMDKIKTHASSN